MKFPRETKARLTVLEQCRKDNGQFVQYMFTPENQHETNTCDSLVEQGVMEKCLSVYVLTQLGIEWYNEVLTDTEQ